MLQPRAETAGHEVSIGDSPDVVCVPWRGGRTRTVSSRAGRRGQRGAGRARLVLQAQRGPRKAAAPVWIHLPSSFPLLGASFMTHSIPHLGSSFSSVQFSSATQSCLILCDPMDCSTPGVPLHHQLQELTQTHVHRVGQRF